MLSLACILWSTEGRWKIAGLAGLLAALTRSAGFLLIVPMVICYYEQRDWKLRRTDASAASLLMIPEGLMVWMAYLSLGFGKPLLFAQVQDQWRRYMAVPTFALWKSLEAAFQGARQLISAQTSHLYWPASQPGAAMPLAVANLINLWSFVVAVLAIFYGLRRLPVALSAYAIVTIGYPLLFPATSMPLMSMPRFVLAAFPIFMSIAIFTERRPRSTPHLAGLIDRLLRHPHGQVRDVQLGGLTARHRGGGAPGAQKICGSAARRVDPHAQHVAPGRSARSSVQPPGPAQAGRAPARPRPAGAAEAPVGRPGDLHARSGPADGNGDRDRVVAGRGDGRRRRRPARAGAAAPAPAPPATTSGDGSRSR